MNIFNLLGNALAKPVKTGVGNMIQGYASTILLGAIGYGAAAIFENGKWIIYRLLPNSFFKEALVSSKGVYTLSVLGTACAFVYKELPFWQKLIPTAGAAIYYGFNFYTLHQAGLDFEEGSVINKAHSMLGLYLDRPEVKKVAIEYNFDLKKITILAQAVKKLHGLRVSVKDVQEMLDAYEFNLDKVNILVEVMKKMKGFGVSVKDVQKILDLGHINKLGNDDNYVSLLFEYSRFAGGDVMMRLRDLKLDASSVKQNQQLLLKSLLGVFPPLTKAMVEFASFYVPRSLTWEVEMEINAFLNRDNKYPKETVSLDGLLIKQALIGENSLLLQDLREFFVAEAKEGGKFVNTADYLQSMFDLGECYTEDCCSAFERWLGRYDKKEDDNYHELAMFNSPQVEVVKYLYKVSNLKTLPELVRFLREYSKEMSPVDLLKTYESMSEYFLWQLKLSNWFEGLKEFYTLFYEDIKIPSIINEYIVNKAKDTVLTSRRAANLKEADVLLSVYCMAEAQHDVLQRFQQAIRDQPKWEMEFIHGKLARYPQEVEKAETLRCNLFNYKSSSDERSDKLDYIDVMEKYVILLDLCKIDFNHFSELAKPDKHFNGDNAKIIENKKLLSLFHVLKIIHSDYFLLEQKVSKQLSAIAKSDNSAIMCNNIIKTLTGQIDEIYEYSEKICSNRIKGANAFADIICGLSKGMYFNLKYVNAACVNSLMNVMGEGNSGHNQSNNEELLQFLTNSSEHYKNANLLLEENAATIPPEQAQYLSFTLSSLELPNLSTKIKMQEGLNLECQYDLEYLKKYVSKLDINYMGQYKQLHAER